MARTKRQQRPGRYIQRLDGKEVRLWPLRGHLFVCAYGCCCGHEEKGYPPVPVDLYHQEWERRDLARHIHLTFTQCLGKCALANVAFLLFEGRAYWFQGMTQEAILALYDFMEALVQHGPDTPLPDILAPRLFDPFTWSEAPGIPTPAEATKGEAS